MRVVVAGGHGKIGLRLLRLLAAEGHQPVGIVRNPDHVGDLADAGAEPVVLDLEQASVDDVAQVLQGADVAVFAAGAGPGSGAARKLSVDRDATVLLADAAVAAGARRFLVVSSMGAVEPEPGEDLQVTGDLSDDQVFALYLRAKGAADAAVRSKDLGWVIVRPGGLSRRPGHGPGAAGAVGAARLGHPRRRGGRAAGSRRCSGRGPDRRSRGRGDPDRRGSGSTRRACGAGPARLTTVTQ